MRNLIRGGRNVCRKKTCQPTAVWAHTVGRSGLAVCAGSCLFACISGGGGKALCGFGAGRLRFAVHAAGCIVGTVLWNLIFSWLPLCDKSCCDFFPCDAAWRFAPRNYHFFHWRAFITGACVLSMYEIGKLLVTQIPSQSLLCEDICTVTVNSLHWVSGKAASHCPKQLAIKDGHRNVSTSHRGAYFLSGLLWVLFLTTFKLGESCWEIRPFASSAVWKETVLFLLCICCNVLHFLSKQGGWVLYILICERIIFGSSLQHIHEFMWHHFQRHIFFPPLNSEWISFSILIWKQGVKRHVWAKPHNGSDVYLAMHLHFRSRIDPLAAVAVTDQELPNFL